jgi:superfamily II DNA or RNA helicase
VSYFAHYYSKLSFPIEENETSRGFRPAQLAAIQAVSTHLYSQPEQPAIVVMPTGSGKTTVLMALAFALRAKRVLILTPSRLVREQIAEGFETLQDLRTIGALPEDIKRPNIFSTKGRIGTDEAWEKLRAYDVVIATVPSISPKKDVIPEPPTDLFDLIFVDEAHHSPAKTWRKLLDLFTDAKRVLLTATPFRNDEQEIEGKFVFIYDLHRAHNDRVFGDIKFLPVTPEHTENSDVVLAKAAEQQLRTDQSDGLKHLLMVRTDSRERAKSLKHVYSEHTGLKLRLISGDQSLRHIKSIIEELKAFRLDGVICVNMLAEGFNLPNLKVAAIHAPHRSLAVTLQFIGRFARTNATDIGKATFLAVPSDIKIEATKLFKSGALWGEIVQNLSAARVAEEVQVREYLDTFEKTTSPNLADFSLYALRPYYHVKVLAVPEGVNFNREAEFPNNLSIIYRGYSQAHQAVTYITCEVWQSRWSDDERLSNTAYEMFLLHYNTEARLLFICASHRQEGIYNRLARSVSLGTPRPLSSSRLNCVLGGLEGLELSNIGMGNRSMFGNAESYRILAGPSPARSIQKSDGRLFDRGHCFGKATENGSEITIGVTKGSKIWSNTSSQIPDLIDWCDRQATKISSGRSPMTGCGLDHLSVGEELTEIPEGIRFACWDKSIYLDPPKIYYRISNNIDVESNLLNLDIHIKNSDQTSVHLSFLGEDIRFDAIFSIDGDNYFTSMVSEEIYTDITVQRGRRKISLLDYLNEELLSFYTLDLSRVEGHNLYRTPDDLIPFDLEFFEDVDWVNFDVAIGIEKPKATDGKISIFEWLENRLLESDIDIIFFDDGAGEMADYITVNETSDFILVQFYHCKAAKGGRVGRSVDNAYEVCGQAVKSVVWTRPKIVLKQFSSRSKRSTPSRYLRGDFEVAERLLGGKHTKEVRFEVVIVQPGFQRKDLSKTHSKKSLSNILAAANDYLVRGNVLPLRVIGSP